jgi:chorismate mutase
MCQKALDLEVDGLMIEVHPCPDKALTDKQQQLSLSDFSDLLKTLIYRNPQKEIPLSEIPKLRAQIDEIDFEIIKLLSHRMELVQEIGDIKRKNDITILQMKRWKEVIETRLDFGDAAGIEREFLLRILHAIHEESLRIQGGIFKG